MKNGKWTSHDTDPLSYNVRIRNKFWKWRKITLIKADALQKDIKTALYFNNHERLANLKGGKSRANNVGNFIPIWDAYLFALFH